jgi:pimeloyl-ACP methyl ester carboxylesterase
MIELPGIGQSPLPDSDLPYYELCAAEIERVRHYLRIDRWTLFSYSSGSRAAEVYINRFPERVHRAVFLCPIHVTGWRWVMARAVLRLDGYCPALGNWTLSGSRLRLLVRVLGFNGRNHPNAGDWSAEIGKQDVDILKRTLRDLPNAGRTLLEVATPALYVWGKDDLVPKLPHRRLRHQRVHSHRLIRAGHSAPQLTAEEVAQASLPFLEAILRTGQWATI